MIINEKIFVCFILFTLNVECLRNLRPFPQQRYNPPSQIGYPYGFDQGQGEVQVQSMNGFSRVSRMQQMQPRIQQMQSHSQQIQQTATKIPQILRPPDEWAYQPPQQPQNTPTATYMTDMWGYPTQASPTQPTATTTTQRFLPHSPIRRIRTTTPPTVQTSTTLYPHRKYFHAKEETTPQVIENRAIVAGRDRALAHISMNLQLYFLRAIVHDFTTKLSASIQARSVLLSHNEFAALKNECTTCSIPELQAFLTILLTIMEKYPPLINDTTLSGHVATEYERASDYLNRKLELLRRETGNLQNDNEFREIQKRYARRERNGGVMSLLLEWFENYARSGQVNEKDLQTKLMKYLTSQKRYWLISIRGVL